MRQGAALQHVGGNGPARLRDRRIHQHRHLRRQIGRNDDIATRRGYNRVFDPGFHTGLQIVQHHDQANAAFNAAHDADRRNRL